MNNCLDCILLHIQKGRSSSPNIENHVLAQTEVILVYYIAFVLCAQYIFMRARGGGKDAIYHLIVWLLLYYNDERRATKLDCKSLHILLFYRATC